MVAAAKQMKSSGSLVWSDAMRVQIHALDYNLGDFLRKLATLEPMM